MERICDISSNNRYEIIKISEINVLLGIDSFAIEEVTKVLHNIGSIVWHNVPKIRDIVVINPQWLADAMAGVVTFISQESVSNYRGMTSWGKLKESLRLK